MLLACRASEKPATLPLSRQGCVCLAYLSVFTDIYRRKRSMGSLCFLLLGNNVWAGQKSAFD